MLLLYGSTAQFGKKSQTGFLPPIQSLENEGILYVFLVFQTEEVEQKDGGDSQTQLCGVALCTFGGFSSGGLNRYLPVAPGRWREEDVRSLWKLYNYRTLFCGQIDRK